jgi:hypothetical protein
MAQQTSNEEYATVGELVREAPDQLAGMLSIFTKQADELLIATVAFKAAFKIMLKDVADIQVPTEGGMIAASELPEYREAMRIFARFDKAVGDD